MQSFASTLQQRLDDLDRQNLRRSLLELSPGPSPISPRDPLGRPLLNVASNDYLGLAHHPAVRQAAAQAAEQWGAGSTASRLICGSLGIHHELETALATFKGTQAALVFSSGFQAALGTIPALVGPGDVILIDRLAHACLVEGARHSGAKLRVFRHNDPADLERLLLKIDDQRSESPTPTPQNRDRRGQVLIITESVFSMDGDVAPLPEIVALKERFGAWLMVDEAHATGVLGPGGRGAIEGLGCAGHVDILLGTLGKALGAGGGFIAGSTILRDYLVNRARSFIFSTAPPPATLGAALAGLRIAGSEEGDSLRLRLRERLHEIHRGLVDLGWLQSAPATAIVPVRIGPEADAVRLAQELREHGILLPAIRYPTVARGEARLRITASAAHSEADIQQLIEMLRRCLEITGIRPPPSP